MTNARQQQSGEVDIVIAGGGMIGSCLACALAPLGLRVAVIEAIERGAVAQPSFDDRSTALARSSQRMFEALGLWPDVVRAATAIQSIHVSDKGRFGFSHIDAEQQNVEALGYVVINRVLGNVLQAALQNAAGVDVHCPARVIDLEHEAAQVRVSIETESGDDYELRASLLVAADGARSATRELMGIGVSSHDYRQHAIIGNVLTEFSPDNRAFERFTEDGPIAMLPIRDERMAFVWMQAPDAATELIKASDEEFTERLQLAFGNRLGEFSRIGKRAMYPLSRSSANQLTANRGVVIGNAANALHPVAAQGFNLGLRDVAALYDCLAEAKSQAADIGSTEVLERYSEWRRADHAKLLQLTDSIVRLFAADRTPLRMARNAAMLALDFLPGARQEFAQHMMGLRGTLPTLSRGIPPA